MKKMWKRIIVISIIITISFTGYLNFYYKPTIIKTQNIESQNIENQFNIDSQYNYNNPTVIYLTKEEKENLDKKIRNKQVIPPQNQEQTILTVNFENNIDEGQIIRLPDGKYGVVYSSSKKQPQTIGYCFCTPEKELINCDLFYQYVPKDEKLVSNYTLNDFYGMKC